MANPIKYSTGSETLALKKGNFYIGTGDVGKGPTSSTGYYNGITPPSGGYTIYLNKNSGGPSIYTASNDAQLISLTNSIAGTSYTTANECLSYFAGQTDKICFNRDYEGIVTDGLVLNLDAGFTPSYPRSGTSIYDVSGSNNGTLTNGPTFNSGDGGSIVFDGVNDYIQMSNSPITNNFSYCIWVKNNGGGLNNPRAIVMSNGANYLDINFDSTIMFSLIFSIGIGGWSQNIIRSESGVVSSLGVWAHYSFTYNRQQAKIYFNGNEVASSNYTSAPSNNYSNNFTIGRFDVGRYNLNGFISVVQLYNRALTATEVLQNFNATKGRFGL
jgi:hypothetical protein